MDNHPDFNSKSYIYRCLHLENMNKFGMYLLLIHNCYKVIEIYETSGVSAAAQRKQARRACYYHVFYRVRKGKICPFREYMHSRQVN